MSEEMPTDDQVNGGGGGGSSSPDIERKSNLTDFGQSEAQVCEAWLLISLHVPPT